MFEEVIIVKRFQLASLLLAPLFILQTGAADAMVLEGNVRQSDYTAVAPLTRAEALSSNQTGQLAQLTGSQAVGVSQQVNPYQAAAERRAMRTADGSAPLRLRPHQHQE